MNVMSEAECNIVALNHIQTSGLWSILIDNTPGLNKPTSDYSILSAEQLDPLWALFNLFTEFGFVRFGMPSPIVYMVYTVGAHRWEPIEYAASWLFYSCHSQPAKVCVYYMHNWNRQRYRHPRGVGLMQWEDDGTVHWHSSQCAMLQQSVHYPNELLVTVGTGVIKIWHQTVWHVIILKSRASAGKCSQQPHKPYF